MEEVKTKRCPKCERVIPLSDFYRDKQTKDGLSCWCKACIKAKNSQHYQSNKDTILQKHAEYYQANKDKISEYYAEYYQANKEKKAAYNAEYYQANKEKKAEYYAEYYQANKEKKAAYNAEYYDPQKNPLNWAKIIVKGYRQMDRERGFDDKDTISVDYFINHIANAPCAHCGTQGYGLIGCNRLDNTKGHTEDNVEAACFKCNAKENIRDQLERGLHVSCKHKKQSFSDFVNAHKAKDKNLS